MIDCIALTVPKRTNLSLAATALIQYVNLYRLVNLLRQSYGSQVLQHTSWRVISTSQGLKVLQAIHSLK